MKKVLIIALGIAMLVSSLSLALAETAVPTDEKKLTALGKYVTAAEAQQMWKLTPDRVKIIDCRTPEEYVFVGHAPMAYNIPSKIWTGKFDPEKKEYVENDNPEFETQVNKIAGKDDIIIVMCRSGNRSAAAVNRLAKIGFNNVYNVLDGFEGDKVTEPDNCYKGKRMKNGWKNSNHLQWTYDLDSKLVYYAVK